MNLPRKYWLSDDCVASCQACSKPFSTLRRRHHCRVCGKIFCASCAPLPPPRTCCLCVPKRIGSLPSRDHAFWNRTAPLFELLDPQACERLWTAISQLCAQYQVRRKNAWSRALQNVAKSLPTVQSNPEAVKIKKILGLKPSAPFVPGLVITAATAFGTMPQQVDNPTILLLDFALVLPEEKGLLSLDSVYLQSKAVDEAVEQIFAQKPDIVISSATMGAYAIENLGNQGVCVLGRVKESALRNIARVSGAQIIHQSEEISIDKLGKCDKFFTRTFGRKLCAFFLIEDRSFAGTVLVQDSCWEDLCKVKAILAFVVYSLFVLRQETYYLQDTKGLKSDIEALTSSNNNYHSDKLLIRKTRLKKDSDVCNSELTSRSSSEFTNEVLPSSSDVSLESASMSPQNSPNLISSEISSHSPTNAMKASDFASSDAEQIRNAVLSVSPSIVVPLPRPLLIARRFYTEYVQADDFNTYPKTNIDNLLFAATYKTVMVRRIVQKRKQNLASHFEAASQAWDRFRTQKPHLLDATSHQKIIMARLERNIDNPNVLTSDIEFCEFDFCDTSSTLGSFLSNALSADPSSFKKQTVMACGEYALEFTKRHLPTPQMEGIFVWSQCRVCGEHLRPQKLSSELKLLPFGKFLELHLFLSDVAFKGCIHTQKEDCLRYFGENGIVLQLETLKLKVLSIGYPIISAEGSIAAKLCLAENIIKRASTLFEDIASRVQNVLRDFSEDSLCEKRVKELSHRLVQDKQRFYELFSSSLNNSDVEDSLGIVGIYGGLENLWRSWSKELQTFERDYLPDFSRMSFPIIGNDPTSTNQKPKSPEKKGLQDTASVDNDENKSPESLEKKPNTVSAPLKSQRSSISRPTSPSKKYLMVPKLTITANSNVKQKITQMEALIADQTSELPISPSLKSPRSPFYNRNGSLLLSKELELVKVTELRAYFDELQKQFNAELEKERGVRGWVKSEADKSKGVITTVFNDKKVDFDKSKISLQRSNVSATGISKTTPSVEKSAASTQESAPPAEKPDPQPKFSSKSIRTSSIGSLNGSQIWSPVSSIKSKNGLDTFDSLEKNALYKMMRSMLDDRRYLISLPSPLSSNEHIFNSFLINDQRPSSILALIMSSPQYIKTAQDAETESLELDSLSPGPQGRLCSSAAAHATYMLQAEGFSANCKMYFVSQFEAVREKCLKKELVSSLVNGDTWGDNVYTQDKKYVLRRVSDTALRDFLGWGFAYFSYMSRKLFSNLPSLLVPTFGLCSISVNNSRTGFQESVNYVITENVFCDRNVEFVEFGSILHIHPEDKKQLKAGFWNDTLFFSRMKAEYRLMIGVENNELIAAVEGGFLGAAIDDNQRKEKDRTMLDETFIQVPDFWSVL